MPGRQSYFWNKAVSQETGPAGRPQAFQWAAPNQAELTFCANKPKSEGDVPGHTLRNAPQGAQPWCVTACGSGRGYQLFLQLLPWTLLGGEHSARSDRTAGHRFTAGNAGHAVLCDRGPPQPQLRQRQGLEFWPMGREVGVAHGRVLSCPHTTRAPGPGGGAWPTERSAAQSPPPRAALPVSLSPSFPPRAEGETRVGRGPLAAPPTVSLHGCPSKMARNPHPDQGKEEPHEAFQGPLPWQSGHGSECKANSGRDDENPRR